MFAVYLLYTISFYFHLGSRIPALGAVRIDLALASLLLCLMVVTRLSRIFGKDINKPTMALLGFLFYLIVTIPLVYWPGSAARDIILRYPHAVLWYFFTVAFVDTEKRLKIFVGVFIASQLFRIFEPALMHVTSGYWGSVASAEYGESLQRLSGSPHDVINPNQLAWVIVTIVPFLYYFGWQKGAILRLGSFAVMPLLAYALLLTGSRTGLICLVVMIIALAVYSGRRKVALAIVLFLILPGLFLSMKYLSPSLQDRYDSLINTQSAHRETMDARFGSTLAELVTVLHRPIFGHGLGSSKETNANVGNSRHPQLSHNIYVETLQEVGVVGFLIFFYYVFVIFKVLSKLRADALRMENLFFVNLANTCLAWSVMNIIYGLACFGLNSWEWYLFGGITAAAQQIVTGMAVEESESVREPERVPVYWTGRSNVGG